METDTPVTYVQIGHGGLQIKTVAYMVYTQIIRSKPVFDLIEKLWIMTLMQRYLTTSEDGFPL